MTNTFTIAMAVFDVGQHVVNAAGGVINSQTAINVDSMVDAMNWKILFWKDWMRIPSV